MVFHSRLVGRLALDRLSAKLNGMHGDDIAQFRDALKRLSLAVT